MSDGPGRGLSRRMLMIVVLMPPWALLTGLWVGYWLGGRCG